MSSFDRGPLDGDIRALLDAEKPLEAAPPGARARVLVAMEARIAITPGGGGSSGDPGASGGSGAASRLPLASIGLLRRLAPIAGAFTLGAATVVALTALRAPPEPPVRIVYIDRSTPPPSATPERGNTAPPAASSAPPATTAAPVAASESSPAPSDGSRLAAERALLDLARGSLASGNADDALAAIARHEAEFPRGTLVEEREAIAVKALVMAERYSEARARGARFRERFPRSIMLHSVESSLRSIPQ